MDKINETDLSYNVSLSLKSCLEETTSSLIDHLVSLIRMDNTRADQNQNEATRYEVTFIPVVVLLLIIEQIIRLLRRQDLCRFQDFVVNMGASLIFVLFRSLVISAIVFALYWIHDNYRIVDLPDDAIWVWILALFVGEFSVYWTHRAMHEINFLWAIHHFHHMTEDLNFSATIRATVFDLILYDIFPLPLAIVMPPQLLVYHMQLSFLYQIWLHNEIFENLGFIEVLINTPGQHRVHHGKNRYCIDKNYGTMLMVWDRLFGTYQKSLDRPAIGLVSPTPKTYDAMTLQFGYYKELFKKFIKIEGINNKLYVLLKGPGWAPGKPRLGLVEEVPENYDNEPKYGYNPYVSYWKKFYALIHSSIIIFSFMQLADHPTIYYTSVRGCLGILYIILFFTSIGAIFDNKPFAPYLEIFRCFTYFGLDYYLIESFNWYITAEQLNLTTTLFIIRIVHTFSIIFWFSIIIYNKKNFSNESEFEIKKSTKDMEDSNRAEKSNTDAFVRTVFILAMIFIIISFMFAYALNIKSCESIWNRIIGTKIYDQEFQ